MPGDNRDGTGCMLSPQTCFHHPRAAHPACQLSSLMAFRAIKWHEKLARAELHSAAGFHPAPRGRRLRVPMPSAVLRKVSSLRPDQTRKAAPLEATFMLSH
jgi:hypothetical protein